MLYATSAARYNVTCCVYLLWTLSSNPDLLSGPVYHEYCDCPEVDPSIWQSTMQCPADEPQILADFKSFPKVDLKRLRQEVPRRFSNRGGLIHYAIINNKVYRRTLGKYTDFKMFSDEMLLSLTRKVLEDSEVRLYIDVTEGDIILHQQIPFFKGEGA